MPFGPKNALAFYTAMMQTLRKEWLILFAEMKNSISIINPPTTIICDDKFIMNDILLFSNHNPTLLHYFSCIFQVFTKYRLSSKLSKCDFLKPRVECFGNDLTTLGNCLAQFMFQLIEEWLLPTIGTSLLSFIRLCTFYTATPPWFETNIKPLRKLQWSFHHAPLPIMTWSPHTISLFNCCKSNFNTSPLLLRYDSSKSVFLRLIGQLPAWAIF